MSRLLHIIRSEWPSLARVPDGSLVILNNNKFGVDLTIANKDPKDRFSAPAVYLSNEQPRDLKLSEVPSGAAVMSANDFARAVATAHDAIADLRQEERQRRASETVAEHILPLDLHRETVADDRVTHEVSFTVEGIEVPIEVAGAAYAEQVAELLRSDAHKRDVRVIPRSGR